MKLLVIGEEIRREELKDALGTGHEITEADIIYQLSEEDFDQFDLIFDLNGDEGAVILDEIEALSGTPLIICAVKTQLAEMIDGLEYDGGVFGMNCLPGFIKRNRKEFSLYRDSDREELESFLNTFGWDYDIVEDRVGMVTPRILAMIINEACYTVQEGTAGMADIDTSMKLGTNYPFGPFEWADKIGVKEIYDILDAMYLDTRDPRYKIAPLLKTHYLKDQAFLNK